MKRNNENRVRESKGKRQTMRGCDAKREGSAPPYRHRRASPLSTPSSSSSSRRHHRRRAITGSRRSGGHHRHRFIGVEKRMRKAKKNIGSKNGLEKACKSGDFTKKEECEAEKRSYSHQIGARLDSLKR
ncbi:hypothetical protein PIB30_049263 [Stylosanthes scabra]|uniref:Uncharacterized protein n=1 Tax=Stylosanthes scabra TaxID=79078 RepID=A0ABU6VGY9_9FABA|nr:hypothetical protein [Stylosanthes scabra]